MPVAQLTVFANLLDISRGAQPQQFADPQRAAAASRQGLQAYHPAMSDRQK
jgi:hypothetical protein